MAQSTSKTSNASEMDKYWKPVLENPSDFNAWTYLLAYTEHVNNLGEARKAFQEFLSRYPYCYGYWNRFADLEKRHGHPDNARNIYEKGAAVTPLSIDLWLHYINFETVQQEGKPDFDDTVRKLFRRAVDNAGLDYKSDKLWDAFINWESSKNPTNALSLYDELLKIPTQNIVRNFDGVKRLINQYKPRELIGSEECLEYLGSCNLDSTESAPMETDGESDNSKLKVDHLMNSLTADQLKTIRNQMIQKREVVLKDTLIQLEKRKHFENNIRRPYFHVKSLETTQLSNWREYLDFEIEKGSHQRVVFLFERCLVACAMYEEFWLKYIDYLMKNKSDLISQVFERACTVHIQKKPVIHLAWAAFEESKGDLKKASEIFDMIDKKVPNLSMVQTRRINMFRRAANVGEVKRLYTEAIDKSQTPTGVAYFTCKYARYLHLVLGDVVGARQVLEAGIQKQQSNPRLFLQLIDLEMSASGDDRESRVLGVFDRAISRMETVEDRILFSQRKMEFLEDFGSNTSSLFQAYDHHQTLLKDASLEMKHKLDVGATTVASASKRAAMAVDPAKPVKT